MSSLVTEYWCGCRLAETDYDAGYRLCEDGYDQRNTGIYLTGLQQVGILPLKAQHAVTITHSLVVMDLANQRRLGIHRRLSLHCFLGTSYKAPNLGQLYGFYGNPNWTRRKANSGKARLKA